MKSNHKSIIQGKAHRQLMMRRLLTLFLAFSLCLPFAAAGENAGVNRTIDVEGTPIDKIDFMTEIHGPYVISTDGENLTIHVGLSNESVENVTNVEWTVQQCINSGVCNPPEVISMTSTNGKNWTSTIKPVDTHSYINYDIILTYANGEDETFPEGGFSEGGKIWSDCWVSGGDSGGNNCPEEVTILPADSVPAPALITTIVVGLSAALLAKRED